MSTLSYNQPLITNPSKTKTSFKICLFSLSIATLITVSYLGLVFIQSNESNPINNAHFLCEKSIDPTYCIGLINEVATKLTSKSDLSGELVLGRILESHLSDINNVIHVTKSINVHPGAQAIEDCLELMDLSRDHVHNSARLVTKLSKTTTSSNPNDNDDISIWLSAVLTNHVTCMDQLHDYSHLLGLKSMVQDLISKSRAVLAIHAKVSSTSDDGKHIFENLLSRKSYPSWITRSDRRLLQVSGSNINADVVVAKDGSGKFKTLAEAVASAPDNGKKRYVIYVKKGVYKENVEVGKKKKNVMIVGDGMTQTIIIGNLNVVDGSTTFRSATLAAVGEGFILQDICIQNTAGPEKHQAVALRVGADKSVINRCKIDAYQDTLYTHTLRQFYTSSSIIGTVDFIFGDAAVVFQNCDLIARKPMANQQIMVTAQGRTDPNEVTGTSIQSCNIIASSDLTPVQAQFPTYLGRPWKEYSRTVYMQSKIGGHVNPKGWSEWSGDFALKTLYYGEYKNTGPGADTSKRVKWPGYHVITNPADVKKFTVAEFIQGKEWLDSAGVTYVEGL